MNKRGSVLFYVLMLGVVVMLLALAFAPGLKQVTDDSRTQLDCDNSSISDQDKAVCASIDTQQFLFIGTLLGLAGLLWAAMAGGGL